MGLFPRRPTHCLLRNSARSKGTFLGKIDESIQPCLWLPFSRGCLSYRRQQHVYLVVVGALSSLSIGEKNRMKEPIPSAASAEGAVETPLLLFVMVSCLSEPLRLTHPLLAMSVLYRHWTSLLLMHLALILLDLFPSHQIGRSKRHHT